MRLIVMYTARPVYKSKVLFDTNVEPMPCPLLLFAGTFRHLAICPAMGVVVDSDEGKMSRNTGENCFSECGSLNLWRRSSAQTV